MQFGIGPNWDYLFEFIVFRPWHMRTRNQKSTCDFHLQRKESFNQKGNQMQGTVVFFWWLEKAYTIKFAERAVLNLRKATSIDLLEWSSVKSKSSYIWKRKSKPWQLKHMDRQNFVDGHFVFFNNNSVNLTIKCTFISVKLTRKDLINLRRCSMLANEETWTSLF